MQYFRKLGLSAFVVLFGLASSFGANRVEKSGQALAIEIKSFLPSGWEVKFDDEGLEVKRHGDIDLFDAPGSQKINRDYFGFFFTTNPAISPAEYAKIKADNEQYAAFVREIEVKLRALGLDPAAKDLIPRNKEEKALIDSRQLYLTIQLELPVFYYRDMSLSLYTEFSKFGPEGWRAVVDQKIRKECREIQDRVISLLTRYESTGTGSK